MILIANEGTAPVAVVQADTKQATQDVAKVAPEAARLVELEQQLAVVQGKLEKSVKAEKNLRERLRDVTEAEQKPEAVDAVDAGAEAIKRVEALEAELRQERLRNQLIGKVADVELAMRVAGEFVSDAGELQLETMLERYRALIPVEERALLPTGSGSTAAAHDTHGALKAFIKGNIPK